MEETGARSQHHGRVKCEAPRRPVRAARVKLPSGAVDCHAHVLQDFDRIPLADDRSFDPLLCLLPDYAHLLATLGVDRCVLVSASCYGFDNRVTEEAIGALGKRARGVASVAHDVDRRELQRLSRLGFVGARFSSQRRGVTHPERFDTLAPQLADLKWHAEINVDTADEWIALESRLLHSPIAVVLEHLGRARSSAGIDQPGVRAMLRLLAQRGDFAVKLSSWYRLSDVAGYEDMQPLASMLLREFPHQVIWGSNWPHLTAPGPMPDDVELLDQAMAWAGSAEAVQRVWVDNAQRIYRFD